MTRETRSRANRVRRRKARRMADRLALTLRTFRVVLPKPRGHRAARWSCLCVGTQVCEGHADAR